MDDTQMTSVLYILQNVEGSCDFGPVKEYPGDTMDDKRTAFWEEIISTKAGDTGFGHLVESIIRNGFTDSAIGWENNEITEGHHRIVAAILLGLDEVPTAPWGRSNPNTFMHPDGHGFSAHDCATDPYPIYI